ncbi:MAG TPA: rhodanese-like domain-containing protein [Casimicrobiaceae bacterium]
MFAMLMGLETISPRDVYQLVEGKRVTVIDVNSRQSWERAHVPGALNLDPTSFAVAELPSDRNTGLVFYCSNPMCRKAPSAARRARSLGYANVKVMSAGISGWLSAKLPTQSGA